MYTYSEDGGYTFTDTAENHQYYSQTTTFQRTTTTTELQWECTSNGYALKQASDLLFKGDPVNTPVKVDSQPEEEGEDRQCQTWYVPSKPVEKPSHSAEYVAPHKRFYGYDRTHNHQGTSNIRGRTISSSGETTHSHNAQSRSNSRQSQHHKTAPTHHRSASRSSRSSYRSNPAPVVSRERAQPRPHLMPVVNMTRRANNRASQKSQRVSQRQNAAAPTVCPEAPRARKVRGKWVKGEAKPKVCFQFQKYGCCDWGARCRFAHVEKKKNTYQFDPRRYNPTPKNHYNTKTTVSSSCRTTSVARNRFNFQGEEGAAW